MTGTILIIGDQNKDAAALRDVLKRGSHFAVYLTQMGSLAASEASEKDVDLVVLNPKKGYLEAMDVYYALKKEPSTQDTPVVLMMDENEMRSADLPSGIDEVLYRPVRPQEAVARLTHLFKRVHKIDQKNLIQRGKLVIDVAKYEVRVGERKVDLTFTEFELLKFLCGNPGTVFTREVLLNKVWGYEYYGGTRTVDVHVRRLRSKIESKGAVFIETVRNIGYRFVSHV